MIVMLPPCVQAMARTIRPALKPANSIRPLWKSPRGPRSWLHLHLPHAHISATSVPQRRLLGLPLKPLQPTQQLQECPAIWQLPPQHLQPSNQPSNVSLLHQRKQKLQSPEKKTVVQHHPTTPRSLASLNLSPKLIMGSCLNYFCPCLRWPQQQKGLLI